MIAFIPSTSTSTSPSSKLYPKYNVRIILTDPSEDPSKKAVRKNKSNEEDYNDDSSLNEKNNNDTNTKKNEKQFY